MRIPACVMANVRAQFTSAEANIVMAAHLTHLSRSGCARTQGYATERRALGEQQSGHTGQQSASGGTAASRAEASLPC